MKMLTLISAYGRDYKSQAEVHADWDANKDFIISDISCKWDRSYINKTDAIAYDRVKIRYKKLQQIALINI